MNYQRKARNKLRGKPFGENMEGIWKGVYKVIYDRYDNNHICTSQN